MLAGIVFAMVVAGGPASGREGGVTHLIVGVAAPNLHPQGAVLASEGPAAKIEVTAFRLDFSLKRASEARDDKRVTLTVSGNDAACRVAMCASRQLPADPSIDPGIVVLAEPGLDEGMLRAPDCLVR